MNSSIKELIRRFLPRSIRPYRIQAGFLRGRVIFTSLHDYPAAIEGRTEAELVAWLCANVNPGETWLDIGAHYGYISLALSLLTGPSGRVYAFEPMLATAGFLNQTRAANRLDHLTILPFALGTSPAFNIIKLPVTRGMADSTLRQPAEFEALLEVGLDRIWSEISDGNSISGVKIDVQGMELDVLTGMQNLLTSHKPKLLIEFHSGVDRSLIVTFLAACGYLRPGFELSANMPVDGPSYLDNRTYLFLPIN
jgi:FkbM family methyltransferase